MIVASNPAWRVAGVGIAAGAVAAATFYTRMDHAAHLVAGVGLVALLVALVAALAQGCGPGGVVATVVGVALAAVVSELTLFGPRVDASDALFTVVGAVFGGAALAGRNADRRSAPALVVVGAALVAVGLVMRYRLQYPVSEWWYTV